MSETTIPVSWELHGKLSNLKNDKQSKEKRKVTFEEILWDLINKPKKQEVEATV